MGLTPIHIPGKWKFFLSSMWLEHFSEGRTYLVLNGPQKNARRLWGIGQTALGGEIDDGVNHRNYYLACAVPTSANELKQ